MRKSKQATDCSICLDTLLNTKTYKLATCGHEFHRSCLDQMLKNSSNCAICRLPASKVNSIGAQPSGALSVFTAPPRVGGGVGGYENDGVITMNFVFKSGTQRPYMPNPGVAFQGATRNGYLPDNEEGRKVLKRIVTAFLTGKMMFVGTSMTTGLSNVVTYGSIHLKSQIRGGSRVHGWPDASYFANVNEELDSSNVPKAHESGHLG